jgi:hypothetical protein
MVVRINLQKAEEGYRFAIGALKLSTGVENEDLVSIVKVKQNLADLYRTSFSSSGSQRSDPLDRPFKLATECNESIERILASD